MRLITSPSLFQSNQSHNLWVYQKIVCMWLVCSPFLRPDPHSTVLTTHSSLGPVGDVEPGVKPSRPSLAPFRNPVLGGSTYASLHQGFRPIEAFSQHSIRSWIFFELWSNWGPALEAMAIPVLGQTCLSSGNQPQISGWTLPKEVSLVLGVGSSSRMQEIWDCFSSSHPTILALSLGEKPKVPSEDWFVVRHRECDGVTSGGWWYRTSVAMSHGVSRTPSVRRLRHVISPLPTGAPYQPISDPKCGSGRAFRVESGVIWEVSLCNPGGLLAVDRLDVKVICPSIFGGQVVRNLNPTEFMDCLDISGDIRAAYARQEPSECGKLPFSSCFVCWAGYIQARRSLPWTLHIG
jgi:hypothetical protein